jgi:hypothetical protein
MPPSDDPPELPDDSGAEYDSCGGSLGTSSMVEDWE